MNSEPSQTSKQDSKPQKEIKVKLSENTETVFDFINEDIIKKHMNSRGKSYPQAKLYQKNGVELGSDDILYLKTGDVVYLARHGEAFNYQQVMDRYEKIKQLGSGGFGKVYLMRDREKPDQLFAVKIISMNEYLHKADGIFEIDREAKTLRMLNSKYIIQLDNYFIHGQKEVILVMEYAQGGELKQYVNRKGGKLNEYEVQTLIKQIVAGLQSCHQKGIIHRDLKMENVLFMDKECTHLKIVDFGVAGFCLRHLREKTDAGTFKYMAPEVLKNDINLANPSMDIWALGIMMFHMLYGFHPFYNKKERITKDYDIKVLTQRIINDPLEIPKPVLQKENVEDSQLFPSLVKDEDQIQIPFITNECKDLLIQLLHKNPKERIILSDVQQHPWFELTESQIYEGHRQLEQKVIQDEMQRQEKIKQKFHQQLQKRNTMNLQGMSTFGNTRGQSLMNGRKMNTLTPFDTFQKIKLREDDSKNKKKIGQKKIAQFELDDLASAIRRSNPISPNQPKMNANIFNFEKKIL